MDSKWRRGGKRERVGENKHEDGNRSKRDGKKVER